MPGLVPGIHGMPLAPPFLLNSGIFRILLKPISSGNRTCRAKRSRWHRA
jgi:hypothetical protein